LNKEQVFTKQLVNDLLRGVSSPALHLPSYNQKTRNAALKIYQAFTVQRTILLDQVAHPLHFISSVISGVDSEKDPRNLVISFDLIEFVLRNYF